MPKVMEIIEKETKGKSVLLKPLEKTKRYLSQAGESSTVSLTKASPTIRYLQEIFVRMMAKHALAMHSNT